MSRFKKLIATLTSLFIVAMGGQLTAAAANNNSTDTCPEPGQIDWSKVPGSHQDKSNNVTQEFMAPSDPLNDILSNDFTAWEPKQSQMNGAFTSTGRAQRQAVVGGTSRQVHGAKANC